jgi:CopA family copper-resistance protein
MDDHADRGDATTTPLTRRTFLQAAGAAGLLSVVAPVTPAGSRREAATPGLARLPARAPRRVEYDLVIARTGVEVDGRRATGITMNGTIPGPLLRFREGDEAVIRVTNRLDEDTSIHWHGIILPAAMDGVPGVTFPGIHPGQTFEYRFPIRQSGTYWFHSHSGFQEQAGHYAPILIEPSAARPYQYDREHMIVLSDWTFEDPRRVLANLKKQSDYYNFQRRTLADFFHDVARDGLRRTVGDRLMWSGMRMNPTDLADVTGATYTYLVNGESPDTNWTGLFRPGERVLLHIVNAASSTHFDVRIPGAPFTVVQAHGQDVRPVDVEEFRIAPAETYDIVVTLPEDRPYAFFAEAMDRSGFALGTLAPREGQRAPRPPRRKRPVLGMNDMGMDPADMSGDEHAGHMLLGATPHTGGDHGPENAMVPSVVSSRLGEPGIGLGEDGRAVLTYADLRSFEPREALAPPTREVEIHLTGNMERFTWGIDGIPFERAEPIRFKLGERLRFTMVNDTMMHHPMHLHGMWMELENGQGNSIPRLHTINVKPAEKVSVLIHADAPGRWALHCHLLYHMEVGMFRIVEVTE